MSDDLPTIRHTPGFDFARRLGLRRLPGDPRIEGSTIHGQSGTRPEASRPASDRGVVGWAKGRGSPSRAARKDVSRELGDHLAACRSAFSAVAGDGPGLRLQVCWNAQICQAVKIGAETDSASGGVS